MARGSGCLRLRVVPYRELRKVAEAAGFEWKRRVGSHNTFQDVTGRVVVIPDHGASDIARPLLRKIIRDLGLTIDEYNDLLDQ
jgi:predicted RNA binding protein YcfA (HicA-like mRNA interferase family)